ncbi:hypothetical protein DL769_006255 [Monosporascus sp. CRB-8-3]|nr:hypothetical protein DL769_006255 [Monosporascus sp. CRB-8-3]
MPEKIVTTLSDSRKATIHRLCYYEFNIRVIELEPADGIDAPLRCQIKHDILGSFKYEAISYTWGPPIFSKTLICANLHIKIMPTLDEALCRLRLKDKPRILWADAVCINRRDLKEWQERVQKMGEIYRFSRNTLIWVGDGEYMDPIMDFLWGLSSFLK